MEELERELRFVREEAENADTDRRMAEVKAKAAENASSEDSQRLRDVERRCQQAEQRVEINHVSLIHSLFADRAVCVHGYLHVCVRVCVRVFVCT